jgi:hypothetical protein
MRAAALALLLLGAAPAAAEDCGKYAEALAYNACLARQGPQARAVQTGKAPALIDHRGRVAATGRRGRAEMVFSVRK